MSFSEGFKGDRKALNGMIPYLPQDTNELEIPIFYKHIVDNLEIRSGHHEAWHTHKRDTSVCWICDLVEVSKLLVREIERYISKSALDIDDSFKDLVLNSEDETVNYNVDDESCNGSHAGNSDRGSDSEQGT